MPLLPLSCPKLRSIRNIHQRQWWDGVKGLGKKKREDASLLCPLLWVQASHLWDTWGEPIASVAHHSKYRAIQNVRKHAVKNVWFLERVIYGFPKQVTLNHSLKKWVEMYEIGTSGRELQLREHTSNNGVLGMWWAVWCNRAQGQLWCPVIPDKNGLQSDKERSCTS